MVSACLQVRAGQYLLRNNPSISRRYCYSFLQQQHKNSPASIVANVGQGGNTISGVDANRLYCHVKSNHFFSSSQQQYKHHGGKLGRRGESIIPGATGSSSTPYGSLGEPNRRLKKNQPAVAWQAEHNLDVQRVTQNALIYELTQKQTKTIEIVVPWFLQTMPSSYFRQVPPEYRMEHIKAIAAVKDQQKMGGSGSAVLADTDTSTDNNKSAEIDHNLYLNLKSKSHDGRLVYTFIRPGTEPGTLLSMVEELPLVDEDIPLTRLQVFSSLDETMSLNMFIYGNKENNIESNVDDEDYLQKDILTGVFDVANQIQEGNHNEFTPHPTFEKESILQYLRKCSEDYINIVSRNPERLLRQRLMFDQVSGTEGCEVHIEQAASGSIDDDDNKLPNTNNNNAITTMATTSTSTDHYWVDVAVANSLPQIALKRTCRLLYIHDFDVRRARLDILDDGENGSVTMLRLLVTPATSTAAEDFDLLKQEIKRSKWLSKETRHLIFDKQPWLGVRRGEIITAMCALLHPILAKENALVYSRSNILDMVTHPRMVGHAAKIADLFLDRFDPANDGPFSNDEMDTRITDIKTAIDSDVEDTITIGLFHKMMEVVTHTLKTNIYMQDRYALGFRLNSRIMGDDSNNGREVPYGILFVHGRRFNGYHVRFRDISRGGLRLVTPTSAEQYALESARQYDECYGLAYAQQLKNKDIPEGGSKAVVLVDNYEPGHGSKDLVTRKAVKAFTDTMLDLVIDTPETQANIVDYFGQKEVLYLGPDEQVIPDDINWIIQQADRRGYDTPAAFMSSKPRAGINHKEYGVTSEGVNVYLDVALRQALNIDPTKDTFTIKMTGGPDGDVAGNEIKILIREYGKNVKFVGIADHSGCAEDPNGLDHDELLRLFHEVLCISHFDKTKIGSEGFLHSANTEDGTKARNTMHNRIEADAFLPCGGRPNTVNITNYRQFIKEDGTPSSPLIVEGANLFVTAEARKALYDEAKVAIVKDSSANKGGVITSSYEICAAMLLSESEFFDHKEAIVEEVLVKLRELAKLEAELLFREAKNFDEALPEVSQKISDCINAATDALSKSFDTMSEKDREELLPLFRAHLPKTIADLSFDNVSERVPEQYIKNAISSCLASKLVYKEGTKFIATQPKDKLAKIALQYIRKEKEIATLMESLDAANNIPVYERNRIRQLLEAGGARTALELHNKE